MTTRGGALLTHRVRLEETDMRQLLKVGLGARHTGSGFYALLTSDAQLTAGTRPSASTL